MEWVFDPKSWSNLKERLGTGRFGPSSSSGSQCFLLRERLNQISEHVYEISKSSQNPSAEIVCFHGLQIEDSNEPHITTWLSRDMNELWLSWLLDEFPDVRILTVHYDASDQGVLDMYLACENLLQELTGGKVTVGNAGCPIILVGHCLGGLILKQLCIYADNHRRYCERFEWLLQNLKGVFCYASPHHGSEFPNASTSHPTGSLFQDVSLFNKERARRNEDFRMLRQYHKWRSLGVGESVAVTLDKFTGLIVPEASSRHDVDKYYTVNANHFDVCRPETKKSANFTLLADLVREIINEDGGLLALDSDLPIHTVGLEANIQMIQHKLKTESRIAMVGMGGVGKTTLARAVFEKLRRTFEYACFCEEVKGYIRGKESPDNLRREITKRILDRRGCTVDETFQWTDLKRKRILVVLDDVESENQVTVMNRRDAFLPGSRVIVTTRDKGFLEIADLGFHIHEVEKLEYNPSKELFCLYAFKRKDAPPAFHEHVEKIVRKCDGLPLALNITGKYLSFQSKAVWEEAFRRLQEAKALNGKKEDGLWSLLLTSYESLGEEEKEMFLDAATCFHGEELTEVKKVWKMCGWASPNIGWKNLLDKHLVKESESECVGVHEVLRDLGRRIAGRSRMSTPDLQLVDTFSDEEANAVKIVNWGDEHFDGRLLSRLTNLKVLWIYSWFRRRTVIPAEVWQLRNLQCLYISCFSTVTMNSAEIDLRNLQMLIISNCTYLEASKIGELRNLRYLEISHVDLKVILRDIGQLQSLESLEITECMNLQAIPVSIGQLQNLKSLNMSMCTNLEAIPAEISHLQSLQSLNLDGCSRLVAIPISIGQLQNLKSLNMSMCSKLEAIPAEISHLQSLQSLDLHGCSRLVVIPTSIGQLRSLESLDMSWCLNLEAIPAEMSHLQSLRSLDLRDCSRLVVIPEGLGHLQSLEMLNISNCGNLRVVPKDIAHIPFLSFDNIVNTFPLATLVQVFQAQRLSSLKLFDYRDLVALPTEIGNLWNLQSLEIVYCDNLVMVPLAIGQLRNLQVLSVSRCENLAAIPTEIGDLPNLRSLGISYCCKLVVIPAGVGHLQNLQVLDISNCHELVAIQADMAQLQSLEILNVSHCHKLKAIPENFGLLQRLRRLDISRCENLTRIPAEIAGLQDLRSLDISWCSHLKAIPTEICQLQNLESLDVSFCWSVVTIPAGIGQLRRLQSFKISRCKSLVSIPTGIGQLRSLQILDISHCNKLVAIPAEIGALQSLTCFDCSHCFNLVEIPKEIGQLQSLQSFNISHCYKLVAIPKEIDQLRNLQYLNISSCHRPVAEINVGQVKGLRYLNISHCDNVSVTGHGQFQHFEFIFSEDKEGY